MFRKKSAIDRLAEERLYEIVALEIKNDELRDGLWAKALSEAKGNSDEAKGIYIKLRVQSLIDEHEVMSQIQKEVSQSEAREAVDQSARGLQERKSKLRSQARELGIDLEEKKDGVWVAGERGSIPNRYSIDELEKFLLSRAEEEKRRKGKKSVATSSSPESEASVLSGVLYLLVVMAAVVWLLLG